METEQKSKTKIDFDYIVANTDTLTILLALAEEASELSQAALKYARALGLVKHPTPITTGEALVNIKEELDDLVTVLLVAEYKDVAYPWNVNWDKLSRWADRLRKAKDNEKTI